MTKAEELLKSKLLENIDKRTPKGHINATLSAMEEQSIKFAEWKDENNIKIMYWENDVANYIYQGRYYTTPELYKLFNEL